MYDALVVFRTPYLITLESFPPPSYQSLWALRMTGRCERATRFALSTFLPSASLIGSAGTVPGRLALGR